MEKMVKMVKTIGCVCAGALAAGLVPFRVRRDAEAGTTEVESLLLLLKKCPGEARPAYILVLLPKIRREEKLKKAAKALETLDRRAAEIPAE